MDSDAELVHRLRSGDEHASTGLVERYHQPMLHLAASFVPNLAVAEEVVRGPWSVSAPPLLSQAERPFRSVREIGQALHMAI